MIVLLANIEAKSLPNVTHKSACDTDTYFSCWYKMYLDKIFPYYLYNNFLDSACIWTEIGLSFFQSWIQVSLACVLLSERTLFVSCFSCILYFFYFFFLETGLAGEGRSIPGNLAREETDWGKIPGQNWIRLSWLHPVLPFRGNAMNLGCSFLQAKGEGSKCKAASLLLPAWRRARDRRGTWVMRE